MLMAGPYSFVIEVWDTSPRPPRLIEPAEDSAGGRGLLLVNALSAHLPDGEDPFEAWLLEPFNLPAAADLRHAGDLGELLDMLDAPAAAAMS